jgi:hypothetical protein
MVFSKVAFRLFAKVDKSSLKGHALPASSKKYLLRGNRPLSYGFLLSNALEMKAKEVMPEARKDFISGQRAQQSTPRQE